MQILFSSTVDESSFSLHPHQLYLFLVIFSVPFPLVTGDISLPYDLIYLVINDEHFYIPIGHTNMKKVSVHQSPFSDGVACTFCC